MSKNAVTQILSWINAANFKDVQPSVTCFNKFQMPINIDMFTKNNWIFNDYLNEYQYVKFNYFSIKFSNLNHITYSGPEAFREGFIAEGINSIVGKFPWYIASDVDDAMVYGNNPGQVMPNMLMYYAGSKKLSPDGKSVSIFFRIPQIYRMYFGVSSVKPLLATVPAMSVGSFMFKLSNIENGRFPFNVYAGSDPLPNNILPHDDGSSVVHSNFYIKSMINIEYSLGCTFKGRNVIGNVTKQT